MKENFLFVLLVRDIVGIEKFFSSNMFWKGEQEDYNFLARCPQIHFNNISFPVTKELIVVQAPWGDGERTDL
jgi:hypothetical protein